MPLYSNLSKTAKAFKSKRLFLLLLFLGEWLETPSNIFLEYCCCFRIEIAHPYSHDITTISSSKPSHRIIYHDLGTFWFWKSKDTRWNGWNWNLLKSFFFGCLQNIEYNCLLKFMICLRIITVIIWPNSMNNTANVFHHSSRRYASSTANWCFSSLSFILVAFLLNLRSTSLPDGSCNAST